MHIQSVESMKSRLYRIHIELEIDGKPISAQMIKDIFMDIKRKIYNNRLIYLRI
jgi:hypothetical protein